MPGSYFADIATQVTFLLALAMSLNLLLGVAGQMSMATAAFYGLGAYTCAILTSEGMFLTADAFSGPNWPFLAGFAAAVAVSFVGGLIIAAPAARRVKGDYLILLTLAFHFLFVSIVSTWTGLTGGSNGMMLPPIQLPFVTIDTTDKALVFCLGWALLIGITCAWIASSPFGRLLRGIRDDEIAVQSLGKPTILPKSLVFGLTAAMAGATGAISAAYLQFVAPNTYSLDLAILAAACVALGGAGNMLGCAIAAVMLGSLRPFLENIGALSSDTSVPWQSVIYGAFLVFGILFRPAGLLPENAGFIRGWRRSSASADHPPRNTGHAVPGANAGRPRHEAMEELMVEISGASRSFGGLNAVQDVSIRLYKGEIVALIGPNGAGKTTVFNILTGSLKPDSGTVALKGKSILGLDPRQVAQAGMVRYFQNVRAFPGLTALDNVAMGVPDQPGESLLGLFSRPLANVRAERLTRKKARKHLEFVGAADLAEELVSNLAFGQQKLVAFARMLATDADVFLLDEPTSGVDPKSAEQIIGLVRDLARMGKTICIVEHSLHVVSALSDRVVFMDAGRVIAEGAVDEITRREDLVDLYFGT